MADYRTSTAHTLFVNFGLTFKAGKDGSRAAAKFTSAASKGAQIGELTEGGLLALNFIVELKPILFGFVG